MTRRRIPYEKSVLEGGRTRTGTLSPPTSFFFGFLPASLHFIILECGVAADTFKSLTVFNRTRFAKSNSIRTVRKILNHEFLLFLRLYFLFLCLFTFFLNFFLSEPWTDEQKHQRLVPHRTRVRSWTGTLFFINGLPETTYFYFPNLNTPTAHVVQLSRTNAFWKMGFFAVFKPIFSMSVWCMWSFKHTPTYDKRRFRFLNSFTVQCIPQ